LFSCWRNPSNQKGVSSGDAMADNEEEEEEEEEEQGEEDEEQLLRYIAMGKLVNKRCGNQRNGRGV